MRLFVAVWPSAEVIEVLAALPRAEAPGVRWTTVDQWHVTLRFLGEVDDGEVDAAVASMRARLAGVGVVDATLGSEVRRYGRVAVGLPVEGLSVLGAAFADDGDPPGPFHGHITLARLKGRARMPSVTVPLVCEGLGWPVAEVALVRSHLSTGPARYETIASERLVPR